ncbi:MAG: hypothetical protein EXS46_02395 [Candidatus Taylorbacteria bacterium]|nr:hypothetical protein [Candidatus Taylorbacteria bacterium]
MNLKKLLLGENLHHAYAITGDTKEILTHLLRELKTVWSVNTHNNPDFSYSKQEIFRVDEARELIERQNNKSFGTSRKIFIIEANSINLNAQNALLKIFEEPKEMTHFFLIGNSTQNLIGTLSSRILKINCSNSNKENEESPAMIFLKSSTSKRLEIVKKLTEDIKDEKKSKSDAIALLHEIEIFIHKKQKNEGTFPSRTLNDFEMCNDYLTDQSAGIKMLFEYMALTIPIVK